MNRRKPIKKESVSFFPTLSNRWLLFSAIFIMFSIAVVTIVLAIEAGTTIAVEDIVAIITMILIPLVLVIAVYIGFEKISGLSIIAGVEWVGEMTLALIAWSITGIKSSFGFSFDQGQSDQPVSTQPSSRVEQQPILTGQDNDQPTVIETSHEISDEIEPEPAFSDFQIPEISSVAAKLDLSFSDTDIVQDQEQVQQTDSEPEAVSTDFLDEEVQNPLSMVLEQPAEEAASEPAPELKVPENIADLTVNAHDVNATQAIDPGRAEQGESDFEASFDVFETELKSFYQENEHNNASSDQLDPLEDIDNNAESLAQMSQSSASIIDPLESPVAPKKTDYMIAALQAAKDKAQGLVDRASIEEQSPEGNVNTDFLAQTAKSDVNSTHADASPNETDFIIKALQAAAKNRMSSGHPDADTVERSNETENTDAQAASLLDQAEQTATSLFSSLSNRFSRSLGFHLKPESQLPSIDLLQQHQQSIHAYTAEELEEMSRTVERVLKDYKVIAEVAGAYPGPIITRFELSLAPGVKVSRVSGLAKDLARAMLVTSVRVVDIIEGTPYIGLEIPNQERELVSFREIIASETFQQSVSPLTLALGKDVSGQTVVSDLGKMPHLLVAGTTGSGKSVAINTMILSMLYKATPEQVRMIMIDPKMLELSVYEGIPHLLTPVVTDMSEAQNALRWAVAEMERRYKLMSKMGVRNLAGFNQKITDAEARGENIRDPLFQLLEPLAEGESYPVLSTLPSIVIIIDELADMMMIVGKKVEELIARLAQKARASGIHLILATQRPSVDVLTGLIKANVPTRISFQVSSRIDSRTILDQGGAESLLGNGDMLFLPSGTSVPTRSHGAFVDDDEVHAVVNYLKSRGSVNYVSNIIDEAPAANAAVLEGGHDQVDVLYDDAVSFVMETGRASISSVQRRFKVGYNRAARMIDQMEDENIVSEPEGNGSRRVLNRDD